MRIPPVFDSVVRTGTIALSLDCPGLNRKAIPSVIVRRPGLGCETNHVGFNNRVLQLCGIVISIQNTGPRGTTDSVNHWVEAQRKNVLMVVCRNPGCYTSTERA